MFSLEVNPIFKESTKGNRVLILEGFKYRICGKTGPKVRWRCASHEKFGCKAMVHTVEESLVYYNPYHVKSMDKTLFVKNFD